MATPIQFEIFGLFGELNHAVRFPAEHDFAIIYGPNGIGKTKFFQSIAALSTLDVRTLQRLPCDAVTITYDGGAQLTYSTKSQSGLAGQISLQADGSPRTIWPLSATHELARDHIDAGGSTWRRSTNGMWLDESDGEMVEAAELEARYGVDFDIEAAPDAIQDFVSGLQIRHIQTERLVRDRNSRDRFPVRRRPGRNTQSTISLYADDLRRRLAQDLARNSRVSQELDRSFPKRLVDSSQNRAEGLVVTDEQIRALYEKQNEKRQRLAALSLTPSEPSISLITSQLEPWARNVLWLNLDDTERKLATFDDLLARVTLLQDIINRRFSSKRLEVNVDEGLRVVTRRGDRIEPEDLSSGEQHELIMIYDLLFRTGPQGLVLIDEPEISLHAAWQRGFLEDMQRISDVSGVRTLVATHSPLIIGNWRKRATRLGPEIVDDDWGLRPNDGGPDVGRELSSARG